MYIGTFIVDYVRKRDRLSFLQGYETFLETYADIFKDGEEMLEILINRYCKLECSKYNKLTSKQKQRLNGINGSIKSKIKILGSEQKVLDEIDERIEKSLKYKEKKQRKEDNDYFEFDYNKYLNTTYWKVLRKKRLEIDGYRCKLCNRHEYLCVHHRNYRHMWEPDEEIKDLVTICEECHENFHDTLELIKD